MVSVDYVRKHADLKCVLEFLAIPEDKILAFELATAHVFRPSYFIAVDDLTDSIVLVIRGTMVSIHTIYHLLYLL